jgi:hemerythrin
MGELPDRRLPLRAPEKRNQLGRETARFYTPYTAYVARRVKLAISFVAHHPGETLFSHGEMMPLMKWSDEFSVGVGKFDSEHQQLMAMINELYDGMMAGNAADKIDEILNRLLAYTAEHFRHEEAVFEKYGYPDRAAHHGHHEQLKLQVVEFRNRAAQSKGCQFAIELSKFLKEWLLQHIQKEDKRYGAFLNTKGIC